MQYNNDEYCLNCLNSFRTEIKLKSYEKVCKKREREGERGRGRDETPCMIYADLESLI